MATSFIVDGLRLGNIAYIMYNTWQHRLYIASWFVLYEFTRFVLYEIARFIIYITSLGRLYHIVGRLLRIITVHSNNLSYPI